MMKIDPNVSIYIQLADYIKFEIFSNKRKPGSKLESIRDMAIILEVNPNTIKRVYQELEDEGLIYTNGNLGTFIIDDEKKILISRDNYVKKKFDEFLNTMKECGIEADEVLNHIKGGKYGNN